MPRIARRTAFFFRITELLPASVDLGIGRRRAGLEEIEIAALVGLCHVLEVERAEPAREMSLRRHPPRAAPCELGIVDEQLQAAGRHAQLDAGAIAHPRP